MGMSHTGKQRGAYCGRSCSLAQRRAPAVPPRKLLVGIAAPIAAGLPAVAAAQQRRPPARPCLSKQCCALTLPGCLQLAAGGATPAVTEWLECALRSAAVLPEATLCLQEADSQGLEHQDHKSLQTQRPHASALTASLPLYQLWRPALSAPTVVAGRIVPARQAARTAGRPTSRARPVRAAARAVTTARAARPAAAPPAPARRSAARRARAAAPAAPPARAAPTAPAPPAPSPLPRSEGLKPSAKG